MYSQLTPKTRRTRSIVCVMAGLTILPIIYAVPAYASSACNWSGAQRWSNTVQSGSFYGSHRGVSSYLKVYDPYLYPYSIGNQVGGEHIQSAYVWKNGGNWIEFGWHQKRLAFGYADKKFFFDHTYNGIYYPQEVSSPAIPGNGNLRFYLWQPTADGSVYAKAVSSTYGTQQMPFSIFMGSSFYGYALVSGEINNQCDNLDTEFQYMNRQRADGSWAPWD